MGNKQIPVNLTVKNAGSEINIFHWRNKNEFARNVGKYPLTDFIFK